MSYANYYGGNTGQRPRSRSWEPIRDKLLSQRTTNSPTPVANRPTPEVPLLYGAGGQLPPRSSYQQGGFEQYLQFLMGMRPGFGGMRGGGGRPAPAGYMSRGTQQPPRVPLPYREPRPWTPVGLY